MSPSCCSSCAGSGSVAAGSTASHSARYNILCLCVYILRYVHIENFLCESLCRLSIGSKHIACQLNCGQGPSKRGEPVRVDRKERRGSAARRSSVPDWPHVIWAGPGGHSADGRGGPAELFGRQPSGGRHLRAHLYRRPCSGRRGSRSRRSHYPASRLRSPDGTALTGSCAPAQGAPEDKTLLRRAPARGWS